MKKLTVIAIVLLMALVITACGSKLPKLDVNAADLGKLAELGEVLSGGTGSSSGSSSDISGNAGSNGSGAEVENKVELALNKTKFDRDERIEVTLDFDKLNKESAVIVLVDSSVSHGSESAVHDSDACEEYRWLADFDELPFYMWTPDKDGLFDVRVYENGDGGKELASVSIAVGNADISDVLGIVGELLPALGSTGGSALTEGGGVFTKDIMEKVIAAYFAGTSELRSLTLCNGSSITYDPADGMFMTVDMWTINDPDMDYLDLAASMSEQLVAAGFTEEKMDIGGYEWSVPVGDKSMWIQLRPYYEGDSYYLIYVTPEAE